MEAKICPRCGKIKCECPVKDMKELEAQLNLNDVVEDPNLPPVKMRLRKRKMFRKTFR